ncbi:MAG: PDZ domain-containing protein, partial [Candidatus Riflebacteria bacterium]|nr:PDZ domain-containing protein [Candidatus Riflebacteria bacterium]
VMQLSPDSPASKAGLKMMDIIRKIDGKVMKNTNDVQKHVLAQEVGKTIVVEVLRNGKPVDLKVNLEQMPETFGLSARDAEKLPGARGNEVGTAGSLGIRVQKLTPELARGMGLENKEGLAVSAVRENSPADKGGLKAGDAIVQVNGQEVLDEKALEKALKDGEAKKSSVLLVNRAGTPMFLVIAHVEK